MKGFICPHCKGSIQIPPLSERTRVGLEMVAEGMNPTQAAILCGLSNDFFQRRKRRALAEKSPTELQVVDWQNGKAKKAVS